METLTVENKKLSWSGGLIKRLQLSAEGYEFLEDPACVLQQLSSIKHRGDLLTFTDPITANGIRDGFHREREGLAVLAITDYGTWWNRQINDKTRNMVRKSAKKGVVVRRTDFDETLLRGIQLIQDEHPVRQGKPFKHYGKSLLQVQEDHASFLDRSEFIGAYIDHELVGFIKLVHSSGWSSLMQIIAKLAHRDKAVTNALLAKAVEICAEKGVSKLQYGAWSRRGIGDFKIHQGFQRLDVSRYFAPLSLMGRFALAMKVHRGFRATVPECMADILTDLRGKLYSYKYRNACLGRPVPSNGG